MWSRFQASQANKITTLPAIDYRGRLRSCRRAPSFQPILRLQPLRDVLLSDVADVLGDQRFDFHLEAVGLHLRDFPLPAPVVLEPGIGGDLVGALDVVFF